MFGCLHKYPGYLPTYLFLLISLLHNKILSGTIHQPAPIIGLASPRGGGLSVGGATGVSAGDTNDASISSAGGGTAGGSGISIGGALVGIGGGDAGLTGIEISGIGGGAGALEGMGGGAGALDGMGGGAGAFGGMGGGTGALGVIGGGGGGGMPIAEIGEIGIVIEGNGGAFGTLFAAAIVGAGGGAADGLTIAAAVGATGALGATGAIGAIGAIGGTTLTAAADFTPLWSGFGGRFLETVVDAVAAVGRLTC